MKSMCKALGVSESGYYRWIRNHSRPPRSQLLLVEIQKILDEHEDNSNYGYRRMKLALEQRGVDVSTSTVYRVMKENGMLHRTRRPHGITKADKETQIQENIISRNFTSETPLTKLFTDITEMQCCDGKLYISPIMDAATGEIVALEMRDNMKKELCIDTVRQLLNRYGSLRGAIFHSDRGSQYTSEAFRELLKANEITQSLSGTGHCYDNARMESFFATLKKEKLYQIPAYRMTRNEVKTIVFRYIFVYYNRIRINTANEGGLPPAVQREKLTAAASPAA